MRIMWKMRESAEVFRKFCDNWGQHSILLVGMLVGMFEGVIFAIDLPVGGSF